MKIGLVRRLVPGLLSLFMVLLIMAGLRRGLHSDAAGSPPREVRFKKFVLDREFRSEGVAVADLNRDGRIDVMAGNLWYEAPNWTPHEIQPVKHFDAAKAWSDSFINFAEDVNHDGWPDQIRIGMPGTQPVVWYENPRRPNVHWPEHALFRNACNESPALAPLFSAGQKKVLVFAFDDSQMAWYEPGAGATGEFIAHPIGEKISKAEAKDHGVFRFSHGLGVGDVNGDGRADVVIRTGYWEAPVNPWQGVGQEPWKFVPLNLGEESAQMHVYDVNGDGQPDVLSSSAHRIGIWWHEQRRDAAGKIEFLTHSIDESFSQSHALELADINGDGVKDLVTGKRFWAHGPTGDLNPGDPPVVVWFELQRRGREVRWVKHEIDNDSGIGTQFVVADLDRDRRPDIVTSNKKGVFVFLQQNP